MCDLCINIGWVPREIAHVNLCHFFSSSWCRGVGCGFCLWFFLNFSVYLFVHSAVRFRGLCQLTWLGLGCVGRDYTHLMPDVCSCNVLRILAVAVCKIGDVCSFPAPAYHPFSSNSLDLSAPKEAYSRNVPALTTLKFWFEGVFKICPRYYGLRRNFLKPYYCRLCTMNKFDQIMSTLMKF